MNKIWRSIAVYACLLSLATSCTVQSNLYVNQPFPLEKGTAEFYTGVGTGLQPKVDSIGYDGHVYFTEEMGWAPNLAFGANYWHHGAI